MASENSELPWKLDGLPREVHGLLGKLHEVATEPVLVLPGGDEVSTKLLLVLLKVP